MIETTCPPRSIIEKRINGHLQFKLDNRSWLGPLLDFESEFDASHFPYKPDTNSPVTFNQFIFSPTDEPKNFPQVKNDSETPKYVVLIPAKPSTNVSNLLRILRDESYGTSSRISRTWVKANLALVIALNRFHSIDAEVNSNFLDQIENVEKVKDIAYRIFGFFWYFKWKIKDEKTARLFLYAPRKAYLLLKCLDADLANTVRETFEGDDETLSEKLKQIVNMQKIRQRILNVSYTQAFLDHFASQASDAPRYLCSQDADVKSIRCQEDQKGLFQHYDELIERHFQENLQFPSFASTGYRAPADENELISLAIEIDMAVRSTMTQFFLAYFPEPNFIWLVEEGASASDFSFIGPSNKDRKLEALRLMLNALKANLVDSDNSVFGTCGAVTTSVPSRMKTKKSQKIKFDVTKKPVLQALRSNRAQLHSFPRVWANQIYPFLGLKADSVTAVTTELMEVYSVFHPITLIFAWEGQVQERYSSKFFHKVINFYPDYVRCILAVLKAPTKRKEKIRIFSSKHMKSAEDQKQLEIFLNFNINKMFKAKAALTKLQEKSKNKEDVVKKIILAAEVSGRSIFSILQKYSES